MPTYSVELRERVMAQWDAGIPAVEIARAFQITPKTVRRYLALRQSTGSLSPRHGTKSVKVSPETGAALERLRQADPGATLQQLADRLAEETGVRVTPPTIGAQLRKMGAVYKRRTRASKRAESDSSSPSSPRRYAPTGPGPAGYPTSYFRRSYPSDLTDAQWELVEPLIPPAKPGGRHQEIPRRELVNGILYLLHTGCTWRALPHDLPHWKTVSAYFHQWRRAGVWAELTATLHRKARIQAGRHPAPTAAAMDSQSAKTTEKGGSAGLTASRA
jgi:putative transposase